MSDELEFYKTQVKILNQEVSKLTTETLNLRVDLELMQNKYVEMAERYSVAMSQIREPHADDYGVLTAP